MSPLEALPSALLFAETVGRSWRPGIGDPSPLGWTTVAAYALTAIACFLAARAERRIGQADARAEAAAHPVFWRPDLARQTTARRDWTLGRRRWFWRLLALGFLVLGVNKQLDLQSLVTVIGRRLAIEQGWYDARQEVQTTFVIGVAASGLAVLAGTAWIFRAAALRRPLALFGMVFLLTFIVIRAASFHHFDRFIGSELFGLRWNGILELGGIGCVFASAISCVLQARRLNRE